MSPYEHKAPFHALSKMKIDDVHLIIEKESWNDDADIPTHPVESGKDITDHVKAKPLVVTATGVLLWDTAMKYPEKIKKLQELKNGGQLVTYVGRRSCANMLIKTMSYEAEHKLGNGMRFTFVLQETIFAQRATKPQANGAKEKTSDGKKQTAGGETTVHIVKPGDTYIALAKKYGTTWQQLEAWNKYPPRKIPVGAKLRVK